MVAICPDFKWLGFQITDPIQNWDHSQPNLFLIIWNSDTSRSQISTGFFICCLTDGKPLNLQVGFVSTLVYIGNRPRAPRSLKFDIEPQVVAENGALSAWLSERQLSPEDLCAAVSGERLAPKHSEGKLDCIIPCVI